jgi:hypothetical protein
MLRESCLAAGLPVNLAAVTDPTVEPLIPHGRSLVELTDAAITGTVQDVAALRSVVLDELGWDAFVDAAAVVATFEMMNRVADATGISMGRGRLASTAEVRRLAGIADPHER